MTDPFEAVATALMLASLCLYLQGRLQLSLSLSQAFERRLLERPQSLLVPLAVLQQKINQVRLLRALGMYPSAREKIAELQRHECEFDTRVQAVATRGLTELSNGRSVRDLIQHVYWNETAKCLWGKEVFGACNDFADEAPKGYSIPAELTVRCLIMMKQFDQAIRKCYEMIGVYPWAITYIAVALIGGRAYAEGRSLSEAIAKQDATANIRVAVEWAVAACPVDATRHAQLAIRKAHQESNEQVLMLASTLLSSLTKPRDLAASGDCERGLLRLSFHNPTRVICFAALGTEGGERAQHCARGLLEAIDTEVIRGTVAHKFLDLSETISRLYDASIQERSTGLRDSALSFCDETLCWADSLLDRL